jgi:hypothetical protein
VLESNQFLFPRRGANHHVIGSDCIASLCSKLGFNGSSITATKQRARVSTIYASLDIPENDRTFFYKHMGHSAEVNAGTYQRPLPIMAMAKVGTFLQTLDGK